MQHALRSDPLDDDLTPSRAAAAARLGKLFAATVATVGAGVMAINPVAPTVTAEAVDVTDAAVRLTAAADPLVEAQQAFAETLLNLGYLGSNATTAYAAVLAAFQNADLPTELSNIVVGNLTNPVPLLTRLAQFQAVYGDDIQIALFGRDDDPTTTANEAYLGLFERLATIGTDFQALLADLAVYDPPANDPTQGPLTNIAFELNNFFVFGLLDNFRPLIGATPTGIVPLFSILGDFLGGGPAGGFEGALPGFDRLDDLLNVLNEQTFVRAAVGPFQTAFFQLAQSLEDAVAAQEAGDTDLAANELANLPVRLVNAFVNGFAPSFSPGGAEWPSLIDPAQQQAGLFKYITVDLPNQIITALGGTPVVPQVPATPAPVATLLSTDVSSTDVSATARTVTLDTADSVTETKDEEESAVTETAAVETAAVETAVVEDEDETVAVVTEAEAETTPSIWRPSRAIRQITNQLTAGLRGEAESGTAATGSDEGAEESGAEESGAEESGAEESGAESADSESSSGSEGSSGSSDSGSSDSGSSE